MSGREVRPEVEMPQGVVYGEEHPGLRWQLPTLAIVSWLLLIGCGIAMNLPHLGGLGILTAVGFAGALIYTVAFLYALAVGFRAYEDEIQIGGLRNRDRRLRRGTWPPQKITGGSRKTVFICPWQATDGLYVLTQRSDIKHIRRDLRRYLRSTSSTRAPLGVFVTATYFANAFLVISNDPSRTESEPQRLTPAIGQYGRVWPVASPTWVVPIRNPAAFRDAVRRLPQAPPVYDRLPEGHVRFEV